MKALCILALLAAASPAFAGENQSAPAQDQKPYVYDGAGPNDFSAPGPVTIEGKTSVPVAGPDAVQRARVQDPYGASRVLPHHSDPQSPTTSPSPAPSPAKSGREKALGLG